MRIVQLLSGFDVALTNEEQSFLQKHSSTVRINSLDEHNQIVAHNLVKKGVFTISKDSETLINQSNESTAPSTAIKKVY
jgi:hypothetical protein